MSRTPLHNTKTPDTGFSSTFIQPKLKIGKPNDRYEQEADRMADHVVNAPSNLAPQIQRMPEEEEEVQMKCDACAQEEHIQRQTEEDEEEEMIQPKAKGTPTQTTIESQLSASKGGGRPMDASVREEMEAGFGTDFGKVRIHNNSNAVQMSQSLNAQAFTNGNDIYFNSGKYNTTSQGGKKLLAHELTHTIQQGFTSEPQTVQKQAGEKPSYCSRVKQGYNVAFYDENTDETKRRAKGWAKNFDAFGLKDGKPVEKEAIPDSKKISSSIKTLSTTLGTQCNDDNSHVNVNNMAIFAHGTEDWCGINTGITGNSAKKLVKNIAPYLNQDVNVILYACSVARGPDEDENWVKGTLDDGGKNSLADKFSDILHDNDIKKAKVWGHTTVGHTSTNFALRYFSSKNKDWAGFSYLSSDYAITPYDIYLTKEALVKELAAQGYETTKVEDNYPSWFYKNLRKYFYRSYAAANKNKKYKGINLAEAAPMYPHEVGKIVMDYWHKEYWPGKKSEIAKLAIKKLKLEKKN